MGLCQSADDDVAPNASHEKIKSWFDDIRQESTTPYGLSLRYNKVSIPVIDSDIDTRTNRLRSSSHGMNRIDEYSADRVPGAENPEGENTSFSENQVVDALAKVNTETEKPWQYIPKPSKRTLSEANLEESRKRIPEPPSKPLPKLNDKQSIGGSGLPDTPPNRALPMRPSTSDDFEPMTFDVDVAEGRKSGVFLLPTVPSNVMLTPQYRSGSELSNDRSTISNFSDFSKRSTAPNSLNKHLLLPPGDFTPPTTNQVPKPYEFECSTISSSESILQEHKSSTSIENNYLEFKKDESSYYRRAFEDVASTTPISVS